MIDDNTIDFQELVEQAIEADYDPAILDVVEDYRPGTAPNIYEWMINPRYMGGIQPWPKQTFLLTTFLEEYCPMRFCTDIRFFREMFDQSMDEILTRVTFLEHGVCPKCGGTRNDFLEDGLFSGYNDFVGCAGQRSSKTTMVGGILATYHLHRVLSLPAPWRYYGLLPNQKLHMTFVAVTKQQAKETLWDEFRAVYDASPWFKDYNEYLESESKRIGKVLIKVRETFIAYVHKAIAATYADAHKKKLRGLTRIFASEDEIGWMDDDTAHAGKSSRGQRIVADADETYAALENSLQTIRGSAAEKRKLGMFDVPDGIHASVSSPSRVTDKIMRLVRQSHEVKTMFAFHNATWEINPHITRQSLDARFRKNELDARRDFGADPPFASNPYISDHNLVERVCTGKTVAVAKRQLYEDEHGFQYVYQHIMSVESGPAIPRCISVDAGETYNHFAVAVCHLAPDGAFVLDQAFSIEPGNYNGRHATVHFGRTLEFLIKPLISNLFIAHVIYDRWNSTSHIQEIRDFKTAYSPKGVPAHSNSPRYEDGMAFRAEITEMRFPKMENDFNAIRLNYKAAIQDAPHSHFAYQIVSVRDIGRSLKKGINSQDDIFRAALNGFAWMKDAEHIDIYTNHSSYLFGGQRKKQTVLGASMGMSSSTSGVTLSGGADLGSRSMKLGLLSGKSGGGGGAPAPTKSSIGVSNYGKKI